jgi:hypothetical protein
MAKRSAAMWWRGHAGARLRRAWAPILGIYDMASLTRESSVEVALGRLGALQDVTRLLAPPEDVTGSARASVEEPMRSLESGWPG